MQVVFCDFRMHVYQCGNHRIYLGGKLGEEKYLLEPIQGKRWEYILLAFLCDNMDKS